METTMRKLLTFLIALAAIVLGVCAPASAQFSCRGVGGGYGFNTGCNSTISPGGRTCIDDTASTNFLTQFGGSAPNYNTGSARYADAICVFVKALETAGLITGNLSGTNGCGNFTGNTAG
jgi:hypothetical protein